jgi:thioredoxin-dependent peroxiredoxin
VVTLQSGTQAPEFELADQEGKTWRLADLKGQKVILYFYPADDTPGCTAEACDFRDSLEPFKSAGYTVLGVSPQGLDSKKAFADKYDLNFPLLADEDLSVGAKYGTVPSGDGWDASAMKRSRSTFIIDETGTIVDAQYAVRAKGHVASLKDKFLNS